MKGSAIVLLLLTGLCTGVCLGPPGLSFLGSVMAHERQDEALLRAHR